MSTVISTASATPAPVSNASNSASPHSGNALIKPGYDPRLTNEDLAPLRTQT